MDNSTSNLSCYGTFKTCTKEWNWNNVTTLSWPCFPRNNIQKFTGKAFRSTSWGDQLCQHWKLCTTQLMSYINVVRSIASGWHISISATEHVLESRYLKKLLSACSNNVSIAHTHRLNTMLFSYSFIKSNRINYREALGWRNCKKESLVFTKLVECQGLFFVQ